jgi:demethylmenaquinone methyltransferase / 2-methoxy-6-polyprenyl-1,4-benzoquinol methylase
MVAGLHRQWRRRAADLAQLMPGDRALDVACGTGDLAIELAGRVGPGGEIYACDRSDQLLELARAKTADIPTIHVERADALELPYRDGMFAAATVGFGARGFSDLERGLREMARVVRKGGHVVVLEIATPTRPPLSAFSRLWLLPGSVRRFPDPLGLAAAMERSGLGSIRYVLTAGRLVALHVGEVR